MSKGTNIVIIGGGPAGLAAAVSAYEAGEKSILILERAAELGGILNQCIHNGFGLHTFKEELTGPEYAARYIDMVEKAMIQYKVDTMVIDIAKASGKDAVSADFKIITYINREEGLQQIVAKTVILAMGCRERARGSLNIPGYRPAGIFSAGTAQQLINIEGECVGREVVILGSGDIGLIMARRMTLEGAKVKVVAELMPYSGGLKRNIVQCLDDYDILLKLRHTVINIHGKDRLTGITLAQVDSNCKPIPGTEEFYSCDTLLLSVGLIPENELSQNLGIDLSCVTNGPMVNEHLETNIAGVFACGNVLHVHDVVDFVSEEASLAGKAAVKAVQKMSERAHGSCTRKTASDDIKQVTIQAKNGVRYTVPQFVNTHTMNDKVVVRFRVDDVYANRFISVYYDDVRVQHTLKKVLAPGEMEHVVLLKSRFDTLQPKKITICIEEA
ncbi:MAG TPA: FAD-dependent oxidoreductase [Treponemataceae bacterium]|nr:FAD-dependent oxidoreductase [Treponemataceae bacterium]